MTLRYMIIGKEGKAPFKRDNQHFQILYKIFDSCTQADPNKRPTIQDILTELQSQIEQ